MFGNFLKIMKSRVVELHVNSLWIVFRVHFFSQVLALLQTGNYRHNPGSCSIKFLKCFFRYRYVLEGKFMVMNSQVSVYFFPMLCKTNSKKIN